MRIVVASDSFKGTLTAREVGAAVTRGILKCNPSYQVVNIPMADGGEGTVQSLVDATGGSFVTASVHDPLMRPVEAVYGVLGESSSSLSESRGNEPTAVIEMAAASGLPLLQAEELNPCITTTYGTGELILHALDQGCRHFVIGLGGSATNDGGMGMLQALGIKFLDVSGTSLPGGGASLQKLDTIDISGLDYRIKECSFHIACDVDNPLCGERGASAVYGPQKGATPEMVKTIDAALAHYAEVVERDFPVSISNTPGSGAAGGLGAAFLGFLHGKFHRGVELIIDTVNLQKIITGADLLITGEGRIDGQTRFGKTPYGVAQVARQEGVPVIALCGMVGDGADILLDYGFSEIHGLVSKDISAQYAMEHGEKLLEEMAYRLIDSYGRKRGKV